MSVQFKQILVNEGLSDWEIRSGEAYCFIERKLIKIPDHANLPLFLHEVAHALHPQSEGELKNHYHGSGWAQTYGELIIRYMVGKDDYAALLASHKRLVKALEDSTARLAWTQPDSASVASAQEALRLARELEG